MHRTNDAVESHGTTEPMIVEPENRELAIVSLGGISMVLLNNVLNVEGENKTLI